MFDISDYTTGPGYLRTEVFSFMAPLLITIYAILQGSDLLAGEEERRTIDLLLANPVARRRVVVEKWLALVSGVIMLSVVLELVLGLIGPLFLRHLVWRQLTAEVVGTVLFSLFGDTLALTWGAATGARGSARGVAAAVAVTMYLLSALALLVSARQPLNGRCCGSTRWAVNPHDRLPLLAFGGGGDLHRRSLGRGGVAVRSP